jgi:hypothetical protein
VIENLDIKLSYYNLLDERNRRLFLGYEANLLGRTGVRIVCEAFKVNPRTVRKGKKELAEQIRMLPKQVRAQGGGRKKR